MSLVTFLAYISKGTRVHIKVDCWGVDFFATIDGASDVIETCKRVYNAVGHHPQVVEFGKLDGFKNGVSIICK